MATFVGTTGVLRGNEVTPEFRGDGTWAQCMFQGKFGGGVIELETSPDNGITFYKTGDKFSSNKGFSINTFHTIFRFAMCETSGGSVQYWIARNSL